MKKSSYKKQQKEQKALVWAAIFKSLMVRSKTLFLLYAFPGQLLSLPLKNNKSVIHKKFLLTKNKKDYTILPQVALKAKLDRGSIQQQSEKPFHPIMGEL